MPASPTFTSKPGAAANRNSPSSTPAQKRHVAAPGPADRRGAAISALPGSTAPKLTPLSSATTVRPGGGQPLPALIRDAIQNSLRVDLSAVRLHTSTTAQAKVQLLKARAFAFGNDIFLGPGEHSTDLPLISHEAAHVLQQQTRSRVQAKSPAPANGLEHEADQAASAVQNQQGFDVKGRVPSHAGQQNGGADATHPNSDKSGGHGSAAKPAKGAATAVRAVERKLEGKTPEDDEVGETVDKEEKQLSDNEANAQVHAHWSALPLQVAPANLLVVAFDVPHSLDMHLKPAPAGAQKPQVDESQVVRDALTEYGNFNREAGAEHSKVVERSNALRREIVSAGEDALQHADRVLDDSLNSGVSSLAINRSMIDKASANALRALEQGESVALLQLGGASAGAHKRIAAVAAKTGETIKKIEAFLRHDFEKLYAENAKAIEDSGKAAVEKLSSPDFHAGVQQGMVLGNEPIAAAEMEAERASVPRYLTDLGQGVKGVYESQVEFLSKRIAIKPPKGDSLEDVIKKFVDSLKTAAIGDGTGGASGKGPVAPPQKPGAGQTADAAKGPAAKNTSEPLYTQAIHQVDHAYSQAVSSLRSQVAAARKSIQAARVSAHQQCTAQRTAFFAQLTNARQAHVANVQHATANAVKTVEDGTQSALTLYPDSCRSVAASLEDAARRGSIELTNMTRDGVSGARQSMSNARATQTKRLEQVSDEARGALAQLGKQTGDGAYGIEQGFCGAISQIALSASENMSELASRQVQGFKGLSAGIVAAEAQFTQPLDKLFEKTIQKTKKENFDPVLDSERTNVEAGTKDVQQKFQTQLDQPREAIQDRLNGVAKTISDNLMRRAQKAMGAWGIINLDEDALMESMRGVTAIQGRALEKDFQEQSHRNLRAKLKFEYDDWPGGLNGDEYNACINYLDGNTSQGALYELKTAKGWFSSDSAKAEAVMRSLTPKERADAVLSPEWGAVASDVRDGLSGADLDTFNALAVGDIAKADAIRLRENVKKAKENNDKDALIKALKNYHPGGETDALKTVRADIEANKPPAPGQAAGPAQAPADRKSAIGLTDKDVTFADVQQKFADIQNEAGSAQGQAANKEDPATVLAKYVLAPVQVQVPDGDGGVTTVTYTVEGPDAVAAEALARYGPDKPESKAALLYRQTEKKGGKPDFEELEDITVDPRLNKSLPQGRGLDEGQRNQVRAEQDQLYLAYAKLLKDNNVITQQVTDPHLARTIAAMHLVGHFDLEDEKGQVGAGFAVSLVTQDVPDNVAALRYAQLGAGTDEDMIHRAFQRMSRAEIQTARTEYQTRYKSDLYADLGLYGKGTFGELSGDDRLQAEREAMGVPQNDKEAAEVALFTNMQQKSETGVLGRALVGDAEEAALDRNKERLTQMAGGVILNDEFGRPHIVASANFDDKGKYTGTDFRAFDRELTMAKITAENYSASIDRLTTAITMAIAIIGAVVATVLTFGAGAPILVAVLVAGGAGLVGMGASYAIKGGRYGWEQALTDLGMVGIQMLTAGVGASLGGAAKAGEALADAAEAVEVAETAGKAAAQAAEATEVAGTKLAQTAGQSFGQTLKTGAITGGIGGMGSAALDERTWKDGIGTGFGRVLMGGARGAVSGTLAAGVTGGLEKVPGLDALSSGIGRGLLTSAGAVAGRAGEIGFDVATGQFHGTMHDALSSLAEAGEQALVQGAFEGVAKSAVEGGHHGQPGRPEHEAPGSKTGTGPHEPLPSLAHPPAEELHLPALEHEPLPAHFVPEKMAPAPAPHAGEEHLPPLREGEPAVPPHEPVAGAGGVGGEGGMRPPGGGAPPPSGEEPLFPHITDAEIDALFEPAASEHMVQIRGGTALDESLGLRLPAAQGGEGPFVDPATGLPLHKDWVIDPATGRPVHKYWGVDPATGMTVQEYKFLSQRGLPSVDREGNPILGPRGNKMTKMRIHSPDPTAPEGSASRRGWTMNFEQGDHMRMTANGEWFDKRYGKLPDTSDFDVRPFRRGPAGEWVEAATGHPVTDPNHLYALDDWDHKMASSHIPLFPEPGERPTPPPAHSVPPETPPPAPRTPSIPSEAAEPGLDETRALSITDKAAAGIADSWFAGDAAEKYKLPPAQSPDDALRKLIANRGVASRFADYVEEDGHISHVDLETKAIDPSTGQPAKVKVRFEMVDSLPREDGMMPVAMYEPAGPNEYIVRVSKGAPAISLKRGIAHELIEIRANHGAAEVPQEHALAPNSKATRLSPHDEGRLAEMRVLAEDLHTAVGADREALLDEAQKLAGHLGLTGKGPDAEARRTLAFGHLGDGLAENWLKVAISGSEGNPFRQRIQGNLRDDLGTLAKRIELAQQLGELPTNRDSILWKSNPLVKDSVEIMRQSFIRDEFFTFKRSGAGSPNLELKEEMLSRIGPPGSVEGSLFDEAFKAASKPVKERPVAPDPSALDHSTVSATRATFGENENFQDWHEFAEKYIKTNPGVGEPDPENLDKMRISDPLRARELFDRWASGSYVDKETGRVRSVFSDQVGITPGYEAKYAKNPDEMLGLQLAKEIPVGHEPRTMALDDAAAERFKLLDDAEEQFTALSKAEKLGDEPAATAARGKINEMMGKVREISEAFGAAAGRAFIAKNFPNAQVFEAAGSRVFDLIVKVGGEFVIVECKGGTSPLGKRLSADKTKVVQQGTREYMLAVANDMANNNPHDSEFGKVGRELYDKLIADPNYKPKYYVVRQGFDTQGRPATPTVGEFDMTAKEPAI